HADGSDSGWKTDLVPEAHDPAHAAGHAAGLAGSRDQLLLDPRAGTGRRVVHPPAARRRGVGARLRTAGALVRLRLRQAGPRTAGTRRGRCVEGSAWNVGRALRETRRALQRTHAALAARPARFRWRVGATLVRGGGALDGLCAVPSTQRQAHRLSATTRRSMPPPLRKIEGISPDASAFLTCERGVKRAPASLLLMTLNVGLRKLSPTCKIAM